MRKYLEDECKELNRNIRIEELSETPKTHAYNLLLKVREEELKSGPIPAMTLRDKCGMDADRYYLHRGWLLKHGYLDSEKRGRRSWYRISMKGLDALDRRELVYRLEQHTERLIIATTFEDEMESLSGLFGEVFRYVSDRLRRFGDVERYRGFLTAVEDSSYDYLNKDLLQQLEEIRKGYLVGHLEDPYFTVQRVSLPALFYDALLALKLGHFLTDNQRYVLTKTNDFSEDELIRHNREWAKRFEEKEVEDEDEEDAHLWRLNPNIFVAREREIREKQPLPPELWDSSSTVGQCPRCGKKIVFFRELRLQDGTILKNCVICQSCNYHSLELDSRAWEKYGMKFKSYYDQLRSRTYSRNGFQHDERWPVDIDRAQCNLNQRNMKRRADRLGIKPDVLPELDAMMGTLQKWIKQSDDSWIVECYDRNTGDLINRIEVRR